MQGYIIKYCKQNLFDELKQHLLKNFLKKSILADYIRDTIFHEQLVFKDVENLFDVDYFAHNFHDSMQDANLTYDQQQIFQHLISSM